MKANVKSIDWSNKEAGELKVIISAKGSDYIEQPTTYGFPSIRNSNPIVEGFDYVLEFGHLAVSAMKGNGDFMELAEENRLLRTGIKQSVLADRVRQLLSAIDYGMLTDFQAKCVLLVERELK